MSNFKSFVMSIYINYLSPFVLILFLHGFYALNKDNNLIKLFHNQNKVDNPITTSVYPFYIAEIFFLRTH